MTMRKSTRKMTVTDPSKMLSIAYITAFSIIALLTGASHALTAHITDKQKESAQVSYRLGNLRSTIEQVSSYAESFQDTGEDFDFERLTFALEKLESSHAYIQQSIAQIEKDNTSLFSTISRLANPQLKKDNTNLFMYKSDEGHSGLYIVYYEAPYFLNTDINAFIAAAKKIKRSDKFGANPERQKVYKRVSKNYSALLSPALNAALGNYQAETVYKIVGFYNLQLASVYGIIIVLFLEAVFIFRPLVRRIHEYHKKLLRIAHEDPLTGLDNRRLFTIKAEKALYAAHIDNTEIAIALTDLDKFKQVNDTYGHDVGDKVLQHFAEILSSSVRDGDIIGRIGGEEFALVLPECSLKGATQVLERIRKITQATPCSYISEEGNPEELSYTLSTGFVLLVPGATDRLEDLLKIADAGLYKAKKEGRNRVIAMPSPHTAKKEKQSPDKDRRI